MKLERRVVLGAALTSFFAIAVGSAGAQSVGGTLPAKTGTAGAIGRYEVFTIPFDPELAFRSATYTPSGKVLVSYAENPNQPRREIMLATQDDDGRNFRPFFSQALPERPKDNGIRFMVFADNKRIFTGDHVIECTTSLETCKDAKLLPVEYPAEIADGDHISHRWSEMIVAPDNKHVSWTTLFSNYSAMVFTGELKRTPAGYKIAKTRIVSTIDPFEPDPKHADGVIPQPLRGGEVKQFVHGGTGISLAGMRHRDLADSTVLHLPTGKVEAITETPGYDETTIFSPDERLGVVMTSRFSPKTNLAVLDLLPRPYPDGLNMGLNSLAYNYSVSGVRQTRSGNIGPALIEIDPSKMKEGYVGTNLNVQEDWVFGSPLSWHPSSTKAMWIERQRGERREEGARQPGRMQAVRLLDYKPGPAVRVQPTPENMAYASSDLSVAKSYAGKTRDIDAKVYGKQSGHLVYRRTPTGLIEKTYFNFSDDGQHVYNGRETMQNNPRGNSTYIADVALTGPKPGVMKLKMTFGPATDFYEPTKIVFAPDESGVPLSGGYVEYDGQRLEVSSLAS
ncbi:hypothetical protein ABVV53_03455 [Novosphingobium sp. RD2P27]|uniref:Uncharacterized protein n=1 Tax=Novosphingobium kalidii TaxID=3230299 RepID=A0ABV2CY36_9SPHN